jgi:hypothetical protein
MVKRCTFTKVMKPELEDGLLDELELEPEPAPRPPATDGDEPLELPPDEPDEPAVMLSPTAPFTAATVPLVGAISFVAASAFSALVTVSFALSTPACAAATDTVLPVEPPAEPPLDCGAAVGWRVVWLGAGVAAFLVLVCLGAVVFGLGVVVVGVVVVGVVSVGVVVVSVVLM